jgi:hypothetical protein
VAVADHGHHGNQYRFDSFKTEKEISKESLSLILAAPRAIFITTAMAFNALFKFLYAFFQMLTSDFLKRMFMAPIACVPLVIIGNVAC